MFHELILCVQWMPHCSSVNNPATRLRYLHSSYQELKLFLQQFETVGLSHGGPLAAEEIYHQQ